MMECIIDLKNIIPYIPILVFDKSFKKLIYDGLTVQWRRCKCFCDQLLLKEPKMF